MNGESIDIGTSSRLRAAAIDTGTTLIGGPPDVVNDIFSKIPGSQPGVGDFDGYYTYPCSTKVNIQSRLVGRSGISTPTIFFSPVDENAMFRSIISTGHGGQRSIMDHRRHIFGKHQSFTDPLFGPVLILHLKEKRLLRVSS